MGIETALLDFITLVYDTVGWYGVAGLMAVESTAIPLPSELVMPFAGWKLVLERGGGLWGVVLAGTVGASGSVVGSLAEYWLARVGGRALLERYGKYILITTSDIERSEKWFARSGDKTILIARLVPGVRGFISIPAGIAKMNPYKFVLFTFIGALAWCTLLAWLGYLLGEHYTQIRSFLRPVELPLIVLGIILVIYLFARRLATVWRASKG